MGFTVKVIDRQDLDGEGGRACDSCEPCMPSGIGVALRATGRASDFCINGCDIGKSEGEAATAAELSPLED